MFLAIGLAASVHATTLQSLSTDDMVSKSTTIVHAKVVGMRTAFSGQDIFTYYQLQVIESWKSPMTQPVEVAVPGGASRGSRQTVVGAPSLSIGGEYVMFVWTSKSGLSQVLGLSQGLFNVRTSSNGDPVLVRPAITDLMLDSTGQVVNPQAITMTLSDLRAKIQQLGAGTK